MYYLHLLRYAKEKLHLRMWNLSSIYLCELDFKEILFFPSFVLLMYFISNFYGNKKENFKMLEDEGGCEGGDGVKRKL